MDLSKTLQSPLAKMALGALSGGMTLGPALGIGTTAGAIAGGVGAASNSPLGKMIGLTSTGLNINNMLKGAPPGAGVGKDVGAAVGADAGTSAMSRALQSGLLQPDVLIHNGLNFANDKALPLDYDTRMSIIEPLLRAKHFGPGGGIS